MHIISLEDAKLLFKHYPRQPVESVIKARVELPLATSRARKGWLSSYSAFVTYFLKRYATDDKIVSVDVEICRLKQDSFLVAEYRQERSYNKLLRRRRINTGNAQGPFRQSRQKVNMSHIGSVVFREPDGTITGFGAKDWIVCRPPGKQTVHWQPVRLQRNGKKSIAENNQYTPTTWSTSNEHQTPVFVKVPWSRLKSLDTNQPCPWAKSSQQSNQAN